MLLTARAICLICLFMDYAKTPWKLIEEYARARDFNEHTIRKWRQRGVPWKQRFELRELHPFIFSNPKNFGPFSEAGKPGRKPKAPAKAPAKPRRKAA